MADRNKRLPDNVDGDFFVDSTCINCDTCRQLAPGTFRDAGHHSSVYAQPGDKRQLRQAFRALLACPTGSIGTSGSNDARQVMSDFPLPIEGEVYYCGFNSPKSYGGNSYFIAREEGNWLIDSPKYVPHLVKRFEEMGGIKYIFLTHRDDVAEAHRFAEHFNCKRIIHRLGLDAQPEAEIVIEGRDEWQFKPDFLIVPTPGHTRCHCVLIYKQDFLFAGDHLWWSRELNSLAASKRVCWYSWAEQARSMGRLEKHSFEWVLPGHGQRVKLSRREAREHLHALVERMQLS